MLCWILWLGSHKRSCWPTRVVMSFVVIARVQLVKVVMMWRETVVIESNMSTV